MSIRTMPDSGCFDTFIFFSGMTLAFSGSQQVYFNNDLSEHDADLMHLAVINQRDMGGACQNFAVEFCKRHAF